MYFRKRGYGQMHRQGKLLKLPYFFIVSRWSEDYHLRIMFWYPWPFSLFCMHMFTCFVLNSLLSTKFESTLLLQE